MDWDPLPKGHRWENPLMGWQSSGDFMQGAVRAEDLPGAGEHAAVFVRIRIAQHYFLRVAPAFKELAVLGHGPKLAANRGSILQVFD